MRYYKCGEEKFEVRLTPFSFPCKLCKDKEALVEHPYQKIKVCENCYNLIFENKIKKTLSQYKMFGPDEKVGVFLSGGKDSSSLIYALKKLFPQTQLIGIHINLGIRYYSDTAENVVRKLTKQLKIPLYIYNLPEKEGYRIDDFVFTYFKDKICAVCGTIKRYLFSKISKELNLDVVATGHHLDDTVSTMLSLFFQGDFQSIARLAPVLPPLYPGQVKKIKPLYHTSEKELLYYTVINKLPVESCSCPHGEITPSKKQKKLLEELEKENRQIKYQLLSVFLKKFIPLLKTHPKYISKNEIENFKACKKCGEITTSEDLVCSRCKRIELIKNLKDKTLEVTTEQFLSYISSKPKDEWVILDVRSLEDYKKGHFSGAIWLDSKITENQERKIYKNLKSFKNKTIFLYCYTGALSYYLTLKLRKLNFKAFNIKDPEMLLSIKD